VLAPGDDIGAVGLEGTAQAKPTASLQHLPHASRDALIAETLLGWRQMELLGLPLFMVRAETDGSAEIGQLGCGIAYGNFLSAIDSLCLAAIALGKTPKVLAVSLEFGLEDLTSTASELAEGLRTLMRQIERDLATRGLQRPVFLYVLEAGLPGQSASPAQLAGWELAWSPGPHQLALPAPGYMFAVDRFGRLTNAGRAHAAQMDAHAIVALSQRQPWACPLFLLAEYRGCDIKVTAQAMAPLLVDAADPFGTGPSAGFTVEGGAHPVRVTSVRVDPEDACAVIVTCDRELVDGRLLYAHGSGVAGAVRDTWAAPATDGTILHRWAYPVELPLHPGAA
jgi:hypothetical protein